MQFSESTRWQWDNLAQIANRTGRMSALPKKCRSLEDRRMPDPESRGKRAGFQGGLGVLHPSSCLLELAPIAR